MDIHEGKVSIMWLFTVPVNKEVKRNGDHIPTYERINTK